MNVTRTKKDKIMKSTAFYGKKDADCAAYCKHAVSVIVALIHKIRWLGCYYTYALRKGHQYLEGEPLVAQTQGAIWHGVRPLTHTSLHA